MLKLAYLAALMPAAVLLALSFFVLFALTKVSQLWLRIFGGLAAGLLIFAAIGSMAKAASGGNRPRFRDMPMGNYYRQPPMRPFQSQMVMPKTGTPAPSCKKCQEKTAPVSKQ